MVIEAGKISIKDLQFDCIIGTLPYERENEQPIILNVSLWLDFALAARNEDLAHSIDYAQLADDLIQFIRLSQFQLEETLVMETGKHIVRWTSVLSNRFDTTAFKREHAELYKLYTKQTASKRFSIA